jgi:hypothetical protein
MSMVNGELVEMQLDESKIQKRKINKKMLAEIEKHVKDETQQKHLISMIEESMALPLEA